MSVLAGLVALLLGGCVSMADTPVDVTFGDQIARSGPAAPPLVRPEPADPGEWQLRLSYL